MARSPHHVAMSLRLRNTLSGQLEPFQPLATGRVGVYSCGPTVYGPSHVGNFRSYVFADLLVRYLRWSGYQVTWAVNITDVDDRIIRDAIEREMPIAKLTAPHIEHFLDDWRRLRLSEPDVRPRATEHIPQMVDLIERLLEAGHAYRTEDGSVFFRISSWPGYGRLARIDPSQQRVGERVVADDYGKDDVRDFALWKGPKEGEPRWPTRIGPGRPGWHIECSAMSMHYLGTTFDLHTGGIDLVFPHHEDEIAQSEAATGQPLARTWLHCAHLQLGGEKMARRTGRFDTPADVFHRGYSPRALRYALLAAHYRAPVEYSDQSLRQASAAVERLSSCLRSLDEYTELRPDDASLPVVLQAAHRAFREAMDDDLNVAAALASAFDLVREVNRRIAERGLSTADAGRAAAVLRDLDRVLAVVGPDETATSPAPPDGAGHEITGLLAERAAARAARDWARSDELRTRLAELGVAVEDTPDGQRSRRITEMARG